MRSMAHLSRAANVSAPTPRAITLCWILGSAALMLGGCVSHRTYDAAKHDLKTSANELAQTQSDIHGLEQQRDEAHLANQRDERALTALKSELKTIQASYDQIHKANQAKLALLEHNIVALRARHQAMLKEIGETKRLEKRVAALEAERGQSVAPVDATADGHATMIDHAHPATPVVAVVTPEPVSVESALSSPAHTAAPVQPTVPPSASLTSPATTPAPIVAPSTASPAPAKVAQAASAPPAPRPATAAAPQEESWFSSVTGWFSSLLNWIWA